MKRAVIVRLNSNEYQTIGSFLVYDGLDLIQDFKTLELPWKDNQNSVSCIPPGVYWCELLESSPAFKYPHYLLKDVKGRSYIKIHRGNFVDEIKGCILVGDDFLDINGDGHYDVTNSKPVLQSLVSILGNNFQLTII